MNRHEWQPATGSTQTLGGICMSISVALSGATGKGRVSPDDTMPKRTHRIFPYVVLPGIAEHDTTLDIKTRTLAALQQEYGATFGDWTGPVSPTELGKHFKRSALTMSRALSYLVEHRYIERRFVSRPKGGRCYQYRLALPNMTGTGVA